MMRLLLWMLWMNQEIADNILGLLDLADEVLDKIIANDDYGAMMMLEDADLDIESYNLIWSFFTAPVRYRLKHAKREINGHISQ